METHDRRIRRLFRGRVKDVDGYRWENVDQETLKRICDSITSEQRKLAREVTVLREELNEDLRNDDPVSFENHHLRVRELETGFNRLEEMKRRIFGIRQRVIVRERMKERLKPRVYEVLER